MAIWKPGPAIAEFRAVKDAYAAEFNFDIDAICDHLVSVEKTSGQTYTKARNAGLMPGAFGFLPSRSAGGAGGGPLSATELAGLRPLLPLARKRPPTRPPPQAGEESPGRRCHRFRSTTAGITSPILRDVSWRKRRTASDRVRDVPGKVEQSVALIGIWRGSPIVIWRGRWPGPGYEIDLSPFRMS